MTSSLPPRFVVEKRSAHDQCVRRPQPPRRSSDVGQKRHPGLLAPTHRAVPHEPSMPPCHPPAIRRPARHRHCWSKHQQWHPAVHRRSLPEGGFHSTASKLRRRMGARPFGHTGTPTPRAVPLRGTATARPGTFARPLFPRQTGRVPRQVRLEVRKRRPLRRRSRFPPLDSPMSDAVISQGLPPDPTNRTLTVAQQS
jgi:hypothetical protein